MVQPLQLPGGDGSHWLGQVDPDGQPGGAGQAGRRDQDGAAAAGHIQHPHPLADARQGQQPLCHVVEEPHLVIAGGGSAEQAGDALLGLLHVRATLRLTAHSSLVTPPVSERLGSSRRLRP